MGLSGLYKNLAITASVYCLLEPFRNILEVSKAKKSDPSEQAAKPAKARPVGTGLNLEDLEDIEIFDIVLFCKTKTGFYKYGMTCISDSQIILDEDDEVAFPCPMRQFSNAVQHHIEDIEGSRSSTWEPKTQMGNHMTY